jgi:hypothetical protein
MDTAAQPLAEAAAPEWPETASEPEEPQPWDALAMDTAAQPLPETSAFEWPAMASEPVAPQLWDALAMDTATQPLAEAPAFEWPETVSEPVAPQPWERPAVDNTEQPVSGPALAAGDSWGGLGSIPNTAAEATAPGFVQSAPADDLDFSLDWSEPEAAADTPGPSARVLGPADSTPTDDLGFSLDWSEPQPEPYAGAWALNPNAALDDRIIMAHWDDPIIAVPEPALFSDPPAAADTAAARISEDHDPAQPDLEQASPAILETREEQGAEPDAAPVVIEQESSPWYTPTLQLDEPLPFDPAADDSGYTAFITPGVAWAAPDAPDDSLAADAAIAPPETAETVEVSTEPPAAPDSPDDSLAADALPQLSNDALYEEPATTNEPARDPRPGDAGQHMAAHEEPAAEISAEQIARIIGMIQSYGPAWFKMWSLELKERPERLPIVLGEVTADPVLLAQAADPRAQSALLAALEAYTAPPAFPTRLPAPAPLLSPAIAGQSGSGEDEVPDWLSLRVKWNGHGGGA